MTERLSMRRRAARCLRVYGADPARWPGGLDGDLWRTACSDPRLNRLLDGAGRLDAALDATVSEPDEAFLERLAASAPAARPARTANGFDLIAMVRTMFPSAPAWAPAMAVVFALVAGVVTGLQSAARPGEPLDDEEAMIAALAELPLGPVDLDWSDGAR